MSNVPRGSEPQNAAPRWQVLPSRASDAAVRYSIRPSPTEAQRTLGVTLIVGALDQTVLSGVVVAAVRRGHRT